MYIYREQQTAYINSYFYAKFHPLLCMCVKCSFPAFQAVSADWGLTQCNYFKEEGCGIDMVLLKNPFQVKNKSVLQSEWQRKGKKRQKKKEISGL